MTWEHMTWEQQFGYIKQITDYYKTVDGAELLTTEEFWNKIPCIIIYRMAELIKRNKILEAFTEPLPFI